MSDPGAALPATPAQAFRSSQSRTAQRSWWWRILGELSSVRTAATLIALIGAVTWIASYYERDFGMEAVHVIIYQAWWFNALFVFITIAVVGAVVVRWPLQRRQLGFVIVHTGLVLLIAGFWVTGNKRLDGLLQAWPDEPARELTLPTDELRVVDPGNRQTWRSTFQTLEFAGYPSVLRYLWSPIWPVTDPGIHTLNRPLDLATLPSGTTVSVKRVVISGAAESTWIADTTPAAESATHVQLSIRPPMAAEWQKLGGSWLTVGGNARSEIGPCTTTLTSCASPLLVADFLAPADEPNRDGRLCIYWHSKRYEVLVNAAALPQKIDLDPETTVTIVRAISNPSHADGSLTQDDLVPLNPLLELEIRHGSNGLAPVRTLFVSAYSLLPLAADVPEFLYSHPQLTDPVGSGQGAYVQLLIDPDRQVHLRSFTRSTGAGPVVSVGPDGWEGAIAGGSGKAMELRLRVDHLPDALASPQVLELRAEKMDRATRWLELEVSHGDEKSTCWIARGSRQAVTVPGWGEVMLHYRQAVFDLTEKASFAVRLDRFTVGKDPGGRGNASFASAVTVLPTVGPPTTADITMNEPLSYNGLTLYQTSYFAETDTQGQPTGRNVSVFTVAEDRGRLLKYLGSLVLVAGILVMYWMRRRVLGQNKE